MGKRWQSVKAQATLFVILGIVLLAVFSFALYARALLVSDKYQRQAEAAVTAFVDTNNINYYVTTCLRQVTDNALLYIGEHGGVERDYWELGTHFLRYPDDDGRPRNISYMVVPHQKDICSIIHEDVPNYPFPATRLQDLSGIYDLSSCDDELSGFFGLTTLQKLCYRFGENSFAATPGDPTLPCPKRYTSLFKAYNIQSWLEENISQEMRLCVDFSSYELDSNQSIVLHEDAIDTSFIYSMEGVSVITHFPFTVTMSATQSRDAIHDFTYRSPVKLRSIYSYLTDIARQEASDYSFNLTRDYAKSPYYDPVRFDIDIVRNPCLYTTCDDLSLLHDDLLVIKDKEVLFDNEPYTFTVAFKNRAPALDLLRHESASLRFDYKAMENEILHLTPYGIDPDDNYINYYYSGWKEDYDEFFDEECWQKQLDDWKDDNDLKINFMDCVDRITESPLQRWTNSPPYLGSQREASILLARTDLGYHNVTVTIEDESGLRDWQIVRILVFDLPVAVAQGTTRLPDVPDNYASVEDEYFLDGSESRASTVAQGEGGSDQVTAFLWEGRFADETRNFMITFDEHGAMRAIPRDGIHPSAYNHVPLQPEWGYRFFPYGGFAADTPITEVPPSANTLPQQDYTLSLQVESGGLWSNPDELTLTLLECIPYRSSLPAFPYTPLQSDGTALFDHTCCAGSIEDDPITGTVLGDGVDCYTAPVLQGFLTYLRTLGMPYGEAATPRITSDPRADDIFYESPAQTSEISNPDAEEYENDIFTREYVRYCDGERGNTCTGDHQVTFTLVDSCDDGESYEEERCAGPHEYDGTYCEDYTAETFESKFFGGEGFCDHEEVCAVGDGEAYDPFGPFTGDGTDGKRRLCKGGCSSGDCTVTAGCECSTGCGAVCVDGAYFGNYDELTGQCDYNCKDCDYTGQTTCMRLAIMKNKPSWLQPVIGGTTHNPSTDEYCSYNAGNNICRNTIVYTCRYPNGQRNLLLREDYCDACTLAEGRTLGDYCPVPGTTHEGVCYYDGPRSCTGTTCSLQTKSMSTLSCAADQTPKCSPTSGPSCDGALGPPIV